MEDPIAANVFKRRANRDRLSLCRGGSEGPYWEELGLGGVERWLCSPGGCWYAPKEGPLEGQESDKPFWEGTERGKRKGRGTLSGVPREDGDTVQLDQLMSFTRQRKIHMSPATGTHTLLQQVIV